MLWLDGRGKEDGGRKRGKEMVVERIDVVRGGR